jgi:hypothetical protein
MNDKLSEALGYFGAGLTDAQSNSFSKVQFIRNPLADYSGRNRSYWFKPDYNFKEIQVAQGTDSLLAKSIEKKSNKFLLSGWEFVGENPKTVEYINKRVRQLEFASGKPFPVLMYQTAADMNRFNNAMWIFVRDENKSGGKPYKRAGTTIDPIAGIFIAPWETLEFKTKKNGDLDRVRQVIPGVPETPQFKATDTLHFYTNRYPGVAYGTPMLTAVLEDILLLRGIEEKVEQLIEANLFPLFHYKVGTEKYPEKTNLKTGERESEKIAQTLSYMPASGVYISDWRHSIEAVGSEGKALRIDYYLQYFKARVYAGLGVSPVDFGEGESANRSTAQTQSKSLTESVESLQEIMKVFINHYLIIPLLLESDFKFDPLAPENIVEIDFGKIDTEERNARDANSLSLFTSNLIDHEETRKRLRARPMRPEQEARLQYHLFPDQKAEAAKETAVVKAGSAESTQAKNQYGTNTKKASRVKDELDFSMGMLKDDLEKRYLSLGPKIRVVGTEFLDEWAEEFGGRLTVLLNDRFIAGYESTGKSYDVIEHIEHLDSFSDVGYLTANDLVRNLKSKIDSLHNTGVSISTIVNISSWRIQDMQERLLKGAFEAGRQFSEINIFNPPGIIPNG